eukprot:scaffold82974_cov20-Tisochrysis_lutea.AAC.1
MHDQSQAIADFDGMAHQGSACFDSSMKLNPGSGMLSRLHLAAGNILAHSFGSKQDSQALFSSR